MDVFKKKFWTKHFTMAAKNRNPFSAPSPKRKGSITAAQGCFTVYVGPEKERFLVKTETVNHPHFRPLLDAAETEYGFTGDGPIQLPCDVDLFYRVLAEIGCGDGGGEEGENGSNVGCCSPLVLRSPARRSSDLISSSVGKSSDSYNGSYRILASPRLLKLNR